MKATLALCSALATGVLSATVLAAASAAGGYPAQVMPSYPYPSYCERCFGAWQVVPQSRVVVTRPTRHRSHTSSDDKAPK
jgi:hypothetical protein